jgi:hypothetical protein
MRPWAIYPIREESKVALCRALALPPEDPICTPGSLVYHRDVVKKVEVIFPPGSTSYSEVEAKLSVFPHIWAEGRSPWESVVSRCYTYWLIENGGPWTAFTVVDGVVTQITFSEVPEPEPLFSEGSDGGRRNTLPCQPAQTPRPSP